MIKLTQKIEPGHKPDSSLTLPWDQRLKSRLRVILDNGDEAGIVLPRGTILRGGDLLRSETGLVVEVKSAVETVTTVRVGDNLLLARICYHLGNRHVPLEVAEGQARYLHDHVLDEMVAGLGGEILIEKVGFEPEHGAYGGHGHGHSHG